MAGFSALGSVKHRDVYRFLQGHGFIFIKGKRGRHDKWKNSQTGHTVPLTGKNKRSDFSKDVLSRELKKMGFDAEYYTRWIKKN